MKPRCLLGLLLAAGCADASYAAPAAPAGPPAPADAQLADDACVAHGWIDTGRRDYPVPTNRELGFPDGTTAGWFLDPDGWHPIEAACDLRDRVVMLADQASGGTTAGTMLIWSRRDGSVKRFPIDDSSSAAGHTVTIVNSAPAEDRFIKFTRDNTMFHASIGPSYATLTPGRGGDREGLEYLVACSTRQHFAEIDARLPAACTTFPDGVGWPLSITVTDAKDASTTTQGALAAISADRTTWTYRFGTGDARVELELQLGAKRRGVLRFANERSESCAMIFTDHRRTP